MNPRARVLRLLRGAPGRCLVAGVVTAAMVGGVGGAGTDAATAQAMPHLDHVFLIMEENNGYSDVIGNPAAPNLNYLARTFGYATEYYGVSPASSESNYVGMMGGNTFGIKSDDAYWTQEINEPSLISELDKGGVSWKAYLQGLPHADYQGICYPIRCNGAPDTDPLYVSKHDAIQNYTTSLNPYDWAHQVPITQLDTDLHDNNVPSFSYIVPDECHDMHGDPPYCLDSGNIGDPQNQHLVAFGDAYLGALVSDITNAPFWAKGNNAIAITYDNGDTNQGCCDAKPGGGQVAAIVVTSHGPRGILYSNPSNHYSLLSSILGTFGLPCLQFTCDTAHVQAMAPLFAVTGSKAIATKPLSVPYYKTPTPGAPHEPKSMTSDTPSSGGWTVQSAQRFGKSDNSLGPIAGSSPSDVWALGDFLPDSPHSNQDATLSFAEHYNGKTWTVVPTPNTGPNFNSFYAATAIDGKAWAVGEHLNSKYEDRALIEYWNGTKWTIADNPQPSPSRDMFWGASAVSPSDVWVVGDQEGSNGDFETLAEHWNGTSWSVVPTPDPGTTGNHLSAVDAVSPNDVWAVGQQNGEEAPDQALVEHYNGTAWSVVTTPVSPSSTSSLDGVAVSGNQVWAVGESDSPSGGLPLVEHDDNGVWSTPSVPTGPNTKWTDLYGVAIAGKTVWIVGTYLDKTRADSNNALVDYGDASGFTLDRAPDPGSGGNILGGVTNVDGHLWAAGMYDNGGSELPFIEDR